MADENKTEENIGQSVRINTDKKAWGATSLQDNIYILTDELVLVFTDTKPFNLIDEIKIPLEKRIFLSDITTSIVTKCLYLADQSDDPTKKKKEEAINKSFVWKITKPANKEERKVLKWVTSNEGKFVTVSVTSDNNVLVSVAATMNRLQIYEPDKGELIVTIQLPNIRYINHALESQQVYVVSYGKNDPEKTGICRVTKTSPYPIIGVLKGVSLNHPWYLANFEDDEILLTDSWNDRILLLDSNFKLKKELLTKQKNGINEPRRLTYVKKKKMLIIAHRDATRKPVVDIFYQ